MISYSYIIWGIILVVVIFLLDEAVCKTLSSHSSSNYADIWQNIGHKNDVIILNILSNRWKSEVLIFWTQKSSRIVLQL